MVACPSGTDSLSRGYSAPHPLTAGQGFSLPETLVSEGRWMDGGVAQKNADQTIFVRKMQQVTESYGTYVK